MQIIYLSMFGAAGVERTGGGGCAGIVPPVKSIELVVTTAGWPVKKVSDKI